jgi:hypothetical protein
MATKWTPFCPMSGNAHNANFIECPDCGAINPRVSSASKATEAAKPVPVPHSCLRLPPPSQSRCRGSPATGNLGRVRVRLAGPRGLTRRRSTSTPDTTKLVPMACTATGIVNTWVCIISLSLLCIFTNWCKIFEAAAFHGWLNRWVHRVKVDPLVGVGPRVYLPSGRQ